jgi:hypothetical protein
MLLRSRSVLTVAMTTPLTKRIAARSVVASIGGNFVTHDDGTTQFLAILIGILLALLYIAKGNL